MYGHLRRDRLQRRRGNVLELVCRDVDRSGEFGKRRLVVIGAADVPRGDVGGAGRLAGGIDVPALAEPRRGHREHPAELAAADDPDR